MSTTEEVQTLRRERDRERERCDAVVRMVDRALRERHLVFRGWCYNFLMDIAKTARGGGK